MSSDYLWKIRCPESGYIVADCGCMYCYDEFELDTELYDEYAYLEDELPEEDDIWEGFTFEDEEETNE